MMMILKYIFIVSYLIWKAEKVDLWISANVVINETKVMQIGQVEVLQPVTVGGQNVYGVDCFTYLGSILACDGDAESVESARRLQYSNACGRYRNHQWSAVTHLYGCIKLLWWLFEYMPVKRGKWQQRLHRSSMISISNACVRLYTSHIGTT